MAKRNLTTHALVCAFLFTLTVKVQAQRLLLGESTPKGWQKTLLGIRYESNSFDRVKAKKISKTVAWMQRHGKPEWLIEAFIKLANEADQMSEHIDAAFLEMKAKYDECGFDTRRIAPSSINITIEQSAFTDPDHAGLLLAGIVNPKTGRIRVAVAWMRANGEFPTYRTLVLNELGNFFQSKLIAMPGSIKQELGGQSPCGK